MSKSDVKSRQSVWRIMFVVYDSRASKWHIHHKGKIAHHGSLHGQ